MDDEIFYWRSENFDLPVALDEKLGDQSSEHHDCLFYGNPFNGCRDISLKIKCFNLLLTLNEKEGPQSQ